jgi:hypothetical protein
MPAKPTPVIHTVYLNLFDDILKASATNYVVALRQRRLPTRVKPVLSTGRAGAKRGNPMEERKQ